MPTVEQVSGTLPSALGLNIPIVMPSLMEVRFSLKLHQIFTCNPLPGVNTRITIPLNFWVCVPQMDLFSIYVHT